MSSFQGGSTVYRGVLILGSWYRQVLSVLKSIMQKMTDLTWFCSGVSTRSMFVDVQEHVARQVMEVNYFAPWILTHDLIKGIKRVFGGTTPSSASLF